jgi:methylamine dehydrogenase heavy chain
MRREAPALLLLLLALVGSAPTARAQLPIEEIGRVETLPLPHPPHWIWVGDLIQRRSALVDVDDGRLLGMLDSGFGLPQSLFPARRPEIYVVETHYSRGSRGERSDVLTVYDAASLEARAEVALPPKRAISMVPLGHTALSDDDRFAAVFNLTPATSLSIVDVEARRFVGEIETPGCSLVYAVGERRFASLCMGGALLLVSLDAEGREAGRWRSPAFFDPERDPVTEKAVRVGDRWLFVSFEGWLHAVDFSGETPRFEERWSLLDASDRDQGWRIGGLQHLAAHGASQRLYVLVHQGGPDTHKDPGTEVWVYDLAARRRVQRIELAHPGLTFLGVPLDPGPRWGWLFDWVVQRIFQSVPELGIDSIAVTQDASPRLVTVSSFSGGLACYDALSGELLRRVYTGNVTSGVLVAPSGRTGAAP